MQVSVATLALPRPVRVEVNQLLAPVFCSKTALLEGLEVDQYMLGILVYIQK